MKQILCQCKNGVRQEKGKETVNTTTTHERMNEEDKMMAKDYYTGHELCHAELITGRHA